MTTMTTGTGGNEGIVTQVKKRYAEIAVTGSSCCGPAPTEAAGCCARDTTAPGISQELGYLASDLAGVPEEADLGLGCGVPLGHLKLEPGETVLDLGSGPGSTLSSRRNSVGTTGRVIGVDMTPGCWSARVNAAKVGSTNVDFREGRLERCRSRRRASTPSPATA